MPPGNTKRIIKITSLVSIIILFPLLIVFLVLYFTVTQVRPSNRPTSSADLAQQALDAQNSSEIPPGVIIVEVPPTAEVFRIPPSFVTVVRTSPTVNQTLEISSSSEYQQGALIRIDNRKLGAQNSGAGIRVVGVNGVNITVAFGGSNFITSGSGGEAVLIATALNNFFLIKLEAVQRVDIRTQGGVNDIQNIFDPTGLTYSYFFKGTYFVRKGGNVIYQTPVNVNSIGGFSFTDEIGDTIITAGPPANAIGGGDRPKPFTSMNFPIIDIVRLISWATPNDPVGNFLRNVDNNLNNIRDAAMARPPQATRVRNPLYLYLAIIDGVLLIFAISLYVYIISRRQKPSV